MTQVNVKSNFEDGVKAARKLTGSLPESADDAAKIIALSWMRNAERTMRRNGSVVTGTGVNSLGTVKRKEGVHGVMGASYLLNLDKGSSARYPDTNNYRFIAAAKSYGISRQALAETIADKGTRPHPWIDETSARTRKSAGKKIEMQINDAVSESIRGI